MATIKFFIQSTNNPAGIYVRLRDGVLIDAKAKTKFVINPEDWSNAKGQPKNLRDENFKVLSHELLALNSSILNEYNKCVNKEPINSAWLKNYLSPRLSINLTPNTLIE